MKFRTSDKKTIKKFDKKGLAVIIKRVEYAGRTVRYVKSGQLDHAKPLIVFVHGAPGSSDANYHFLMDSTLGSQAQLISIDRPGYGYSDFGKSEVSIQKQAEALRAVVEQETYSKLILVGHSYGGPIVCRYAMDYPEKASDLLLLAPVLDPDHEKIFFVSKLGKWKPTRFLTPKSFKVATDEKFAHAEELAKMRNSYHQVDAKVVHIHGAKDPIAPIVNLGFAEQVFDSGQFKGVKLEDANHFLPWNRTELVIDQLNEMLKD